MTPYTMFKSLFIGILSFISLTGFSQKIDFFPQQNLWKTLSLDPIAGQSFVQMLNAWEGSKPTDYINAGFSFGFQKSIIIWNISENNKIDIGMEGGAITQFEWSMKDGYLQTDYMSTDFIIGMPVVWQMKNLQLRFRLYHLSSHMGDDYIFRDSITSYYRNNNTYEQLDLTAAYLYENFRFILGVGTVLSSSAPRKPLVFNWGLDYLITLNKKETLNYYAGFYANSKQDNNYIPAINLGLGLKIGSYDRRGAKLLITYFNGPLPYSVFSGEMVQWLGIAVYINPF